jgi:hypothetical protein
MDMDMKMLKRIPTPEEYESQLKLEKAYKALDKKRPTFRVRSQKEREGAAKALRLNGG